MNRAEHILREVADGHATISLGDGHLKVGRYHLPDPDTGPLVLGGLIAPARAGKPGDTVPAVLTDAGWAALQNSGAGS